MGSVVEISEPVIRKSWFFGIGIDRYIHFPRLQNAVRDVNQLLEILQTKYDIDPGLTHLLFDEDATEINILEKLDQLSLLVKEDDKVLIYFSGHGHLNQINDLGYWVPQDAQPGKSATYILNSTIRDYIKVIPSKHTLLISDACFSGSLFSHGMSRSDRPEEELDEIKSRWALCSGRHDEKVYDGQPGGHSPFAKSIMDVLNRNQSGILSIGALTHYVIEQTASNYDQLPQGSPLFGVGHEGGQYTFHLRGSHAEKLTQSVTSANQSATREEMKEPASPKSDRVSPLWLLLLVLPVIFVIAQMTKKTSKEEVDQKEYPLPTRIQDANGHEYGLVMIGDMLWTDRDLAFAWNGSKPLFDDERYMRDQLLGHLYAFDAARDACQNALGKNWRLPTNLEWVDLVNEHGGAIKQEVEYDFWVAQPFAASALYRREESGMNLGETGFYLTELDEFTPKSEREQLTAGYYWTAEKGRMKIERFNHDISIEILGSPVQWAHAYACRCVRKIEVE